MTSPIGLSQRYNLSGVEKNKQPSSQRSGFKSAGFSVSDQLSLSSKRHLANRQPLIASKPGSSFSRSTGIKTQAMLNSPFAVTRNPVSEKEFNQLLDNLAPVAPGLKDLSKADKKALFKRMIVSTNQLVAEANRLRKDGKSVEVIAYREEGETEPGQFLPVVAGKNGKPVQILSRLHVPYPTQDHKIKDFDDLMGCVAATVVLSMLFSPQVIIGGPLSVKLEEAAESANNQAKDGKFALQSLFKSKKDQDADFEALDFSKAGKNQLREAAKEYQKNVDRNDSLRSYVSQMFELVSNIGKAVQSHQGQEAALSPLKIGLVATNRKDQKNELKDVTHLLNGENA